MNDDEFYQRATAIAKQAEEIATDTRQVVEQARKALDEFQSKEGPVQGLTAGLKQTMDEARVAMAAFAENMEALKHNFLFRGFFNDRGYFNLASIFAGRLPAGRVDEQRRQRGRVRIWLLEPILFEPDPEVPEPSV